MQTTLLEFGTFCFVFFFVLGSHAESIQNAIQYDGCACDTEGWDLSSIAQAAIVSGSNALPTSRHCSATSRSTGGFLTA